MRSLPRHNLLLIVIALSAFTITALAKFKVGSLPKERVATYVIRTTDGRTHTLQDMRGQVVVLDFFTVWCDHVREHMPTLTRFDDEDRERGLRVIGMLVNDAETTQARINQFTKDQKINFPISLINDDTFKLFVDSKDLAVPQTLVFARNGRLAAHLIGHNADIETELQAVVKRELAKKN
ncbi:MAG: TlpA family protein disulfide reductase [Acidobacteria bacterium]|nr:TlpA family protein disulfide reductase [Acidobacteriota bacterium]